MIEQDLRISKKEYRNVFIVQNRDFWRACPFEYNKEKDLVLSFDFSVVSPVKLSGGEAQYIDHIVSSQIAEAYNYKTYDFFASWHYNSSGKDIFSYKGIDVGSAFRIEIWNDITFYVRIFINLHELLKKIRYRVIYIGMDCYVVKDVIRFHNIPMVEWSSRKNGDTSEYYFPIFKWMDDALHPTELRFKLRIIILKILDKVAYFVEKLRSKTRRERHAYVEWYHPTSDIIAELKKQENIKMVRSDFNGVRDIFNGVHLPVILSLNGNYQDIIDRQMVDKFNKEKCAKLFIDGLEISNELYRIIISRVSPLIAETRKAIDVIMRFFVKKQLCLMITIASIGVINRLMINYCKRNNIPVYMIINGWLGNSFLDEAKEGTWINAYSESIRDNYFKGMDNVICLGDPRMDKYSVSPVTRNLSCHKPTIGIGASGFANVDLNCYLAIEFEFLNDIMGVCSKLKRMGKEMDLIIKVRKNGYIQQYRDFLQEYYPDIPVSLFDTIPMEQVYEKIDFFISIYSQSLFEASCLGIPVLYYKNDTQYFQPPFDGKSELVTAFTPDDLVKKIEAFYKGDKIYEAFKEKKTLEKYIGPLDGNNLKRNMDFIYSLCPN